MTAPRQFFATESAIQVRDAVVFCLAYWVLEAVGRLLVDALSGFAGLRSHLAAGLLRDAGGAFIAAIAAFGLVVVTVALLAESAVLSLAAGMLGGKRGFGRAFCISVFSGAPWVFGWLPGARWPVEVYSLYLLLRGIEVVQGLGLARAALVVVTLRAPSVLLGLIAPSDLQG